MNLQARADSRSQVAFNVVTSLSFVAPPYPRNAERIGFSLVVKLKMLIDVEANEFKPAKRLAELNRQSDTPLVILRRAYLSVILEQTISDLEAPIGKVKQPAEHNGIIKSSKAVAVLLRHSPRWTHNFFAELHSFLALVLLQFGAMSCSGDEIACDRHASRRPVFVVAKAHELIRQNHLNRFRSQQVTHRSDCTCRPTLVYQDGCQPREKATKALDRSRRTAPAYTFEWARVFQSRQIGIAISEKVRIERDVWNRSTLADVGGCRRRPDQPATRPARPFQMQRSARIPLSAETSIVRVRRS